MRHGGGMGMATTHLKKLSLKEGIVGPDKYGC